MKKIFVCLVVGTLLLGGVATVALAGDGDAPATHTVLVEFASYSW